VPGALPEILIDRIELRDSSVDFFDATVRRTPHRLLLEKVTADVGPIDLPKLEGRVMVRITATLPGPRNAGRTQADWAHRAGEARCPARSCVAPGRRARTFQPYLIQATETGVKRGTLDLDLKATVSDNVLMAPGKLTLTSLELSSGNTFMGMPRAAVVGLLKDRNQRISVDFTLQGRLDDPAFSLKRGVLHTRRDVCGRVTGCQPGRAGAWRRQRRQFGRQGRWRSGGKLFGN
jgi:hypothetical protein